MDAKTLLPTGTVTFLFTDIEGSTRLWEQHPEAMHAALARHNTLLTEGIQQHRGVILKSRGEGDSLFAVFARAPDALTAACLLQQSLSAEAWPPEAALRVRIALHTGAADLQEGDYYGPVVNRCARLRAVAHGGQVLLSQATYASAQGSLPVGVSLRDLGAHRLKDLHQPEQIFQLLHRDLPADFPPLRSLEAFAHNLPRQLTSFIGREREMAEVKRLLASTALLTLTGAGGCGKTRLALQLAADLVEEFANGVWLVELAALADPGLVPETVASALRVREEAARPINATLTDYLRPKALLLVLDNCEHLLSACAELAYELLRSCPRLQILATSREAVGIAGELAYRVPSLPLPDPQHVPAPEEMRQFEAVHLFLERARFSLPSFAVTARNAVAVVQVCQRLDGVPLALELAAARVKALPVETIAERLDDRFRLLTGGSRTALPRQQTLRALIDWSYSLLAEAERRLLAHLAVFSGGWTLEAAEAICASGDPDESEILDLLTALVEKSLVQYETHDGEARYRLLETMRQYSRDRLLESGQSEGVRRRHADYFLRLAEEAEPKLKGSEQGEWLEWLEREHDNLRVALEWCQAAEDGAEVGLRLAAALGQFWSEWGYWSEGREHLARALARSQGVGPIAARARALKAAGDIAWNQSDLEGARTLYGESLAICEELGDRQGIALSLADLGVVAFGQGDCGAARRLLEEALAINRALVNRQGQAPILFFLGAVATAEGDDGRAKPLFEEADAIDREFGHRGGAAPGALGWIALKQGDYAAARQIFEADLQTKREFKLKPGVAASLASLGQVAYAQGDYETAQAFYEESLTLLRELGDKPRIDGMLRACAAVAAARGQPERAARLFGAAEALRGAIGSPLSPAERAEQERSVTAARAALGEEAFAAAWAAGRAMSLDDAVAFALDETQVG